MAGDTPCLAVARVQKPHGLKGEFVVFPLTDDPDGVFVEGRRLHPVDEEGRPSGVPVVIERARAYHRRWLVKLEGFDDRAALEPLREQLLGVAREELTPPAGNELYDHEIPGSAVVAGGATIGTARELVRIPGGNVLVMDVEGREVLVPFRPPILVGIDRDTRTIEIDPPDGLLEL